MTANRVEVLRVGVDVGQKRDPTAVAVVEAERNDYDPPRFTCRFLERLPLGTPYPAVAARVAEITRGAEAKGPAGRLADLRLDATGVGQPVVDLLHAEGVRPVAVYFTHGDRLAKVPGGVSLGKAYLVSRLQVLLQDGRLTLPKALPEASALTEELLDYEIRVSEDANDRYGAFRVGAHDDLVTALGLCVYDDPVVWGIVDWETV